MAVKEKIYSKASGRLPIRMTNDYLFKAVLQKNHRVLKALICAVLHLNPKKLYKVQILNPIVLGDAVDEKQILLDVRLMFDDQLIVDLEMQMEDKHNWRERSLYYVCDNYTQLERGADYSEAIPAIQVGFLNYTLFKNHPAFCSSYRMMEERRHYDYSDRLQIHVIDLTRINEATEEDRRYEIDKWARLFKAETWEEIKMLAAKDKTLAEAATEIYQLSENEAIRELCRAREDYDHGYGAAKRDLKKTKNDLKRTEAKLKKSEAELKISKEENRKKDEIIVQLKEQLAAKEK